MYDYIIDILDENKHLEWDSGEYQRGSKDKAQRE